MVKTRGIGRALREEREARRISLDTIARTTMVRRDYLELIDADRLHELPPGAYAKGFIRTYAQYLGLDPRPFMQAYELESAHALELSAVVRQPVHVPDPALPRAWRFAAGAAVTVLLLLGVLGLFRSSDDAPPPAPTASSQLPAMLATPAPNPLGAVVKVHIVGQRTWVQAVADGEEIFAGTLVAGEEKLFRGDQEVELTLGNSSAASVSANGEDLGSPGGGSYHATFTPSTSELPPNDAS